MAKFTFKSIEKACEVKLTEKNSRFLGFAFPVNSEEDIKSILNQLKDDHPKANHHCYAWRLGLSKNLYRANDDGEPSGSAGRPILGQIDSFELTNVLVVIVRYFGGVKLGVSGLIKAYKGCAKLCLEEAKVVDYQVKETLKININYQNITTFRTWVSKRQLQILNEEYTDEYGTIEFSYLLKNKSRIVKEVKQFSE